MLKALLLLLISVTVCAHTQDVHQYLTKEAYYYLRNSINLDIPEMLNHLGSESNPAEGSSWQHGSITAGSWLEDDKDIVYNYYQVIPILDVWYGLKSITHFWEADYGDNTRNIFTVGGRDLFASLPGTYPNAYTKIKKYAYNNRSWDFCYPLPPGTSTFEKASGGSININHCGGVWFSYNSIVELYTSGRAWITAYYNCPNADKTPYSVEIILGQGYRDVIVWEVLGRMAHLLQDMSVPAHAHTDTHGINSDQYEDWVGENSRYRYWNHQNVGGNFIDPTVFSDPIHYLMYTTQQIAAHFGSTGPFYDGEGNDYIGGNSSSEEESFLTNIGLENLGLPTSQSENFNTTELTNIRDKTLPQVIRATAGLLYWFAKETDMLPRPSVTVSPATNNVGTISGTTEIHSSFTIENTGNVYFSGNVKTTNYTYDLDYINTPTVYETQIDFSLSPGQSKTINYRGVVPAYYGPFKETLNITTSIGNRTHTIVGSIALPDFCYGETTAMAASPEEQLFDKEFIDYFALDNKSLVNDTSKSIRERLGFAYNLLKQPETESVDKICKMIIDLYPESEMGISFYAMGLLWEASLSKESPEFNEKEFKSYLKELTERKEKYKINGYAQLILSLLDVGNDIKGLEKLFTDYKYDGLKELALFHQFIHYYVYKQDKERAREISDKLDKMFADSKYGYQAHLIFGDEGYSLEGLKKLMEKKKADLLAKSLAKSRDNQAEILSEMPKEYKLFNNYPNPFNPTTTIKYSVPKVSNVKLRVYNMMGQLIKTLVNETKAPGFYNVEWNGTNENNSQVSSGIYFYRFESGNFVANNKMILLK